MIGNKITNETTKILKNLQKNNLETVANENDKAIPEERYVSPEKRQLLKKLLTNWDENSKIMEYQKITKVSKN